MFEPKSHRTFDVKFTLLFHSTRVGYSTTSQAYHRKDSLLRCIYVSQPCQRTRGMILLRIPCARRGLSKNALGPWINVIKNALHPLGAIWDQNVFLLCFVFPPQKCSKNRQVASEPSVPRQFRKRQF